MRTRLVAIAIFSMLAFVTMAQDSIRVVTEQKDTVVIKSYAKRYDPQRALFFAAVLPGLGQIYNHKYWKLPLVYGGFFGVGYVLNIYESGYIKYRAELFYLLENDPKGLSPSRFNVTQLRTIVDRYRRQRDLWVIFSAGMYLLQIIDAHVDAHLKEFELNPDLKLGLRPSFESDWLAGRRAGIALTLKF